MVEKTRMKNKFKAKKEGAPEEISSKELLINVRSTFEIIFALALMPIAIYGLTISIAAIYLGYWAILIGLVPSTIIVIKYLDWLERRMK